jgi:thiol-disulfide isomerase/thioredoxin
METWKLAVIVFLLGALGGYGAYQSQVSKLPPPPTEAELKQAQAQQKKSLPVYSFLNQPVPQWKVADKAQWVNTARPLSSDDFKGHVTLLEFFRIDCSHCRDAVPFMKYLHQTYGPKGLKIVALQSPVTDREKDWKGVQAQIKNWELAYPIAQVNPKLFLDTFKGTNFPTTMLIDKTGVIRFVETGFDAAKAQELESEVKKLLGSGRKTS